MTAELNVEFHELPYDTFPAYAELFEWDDHTLTNPIWTAEITGPGVLRVPGFGRKTRARLTCADGTAYLDAPLPEFVCPICQMASYNPRDGEEGYCGACHAYTGRGMF